MVTATAECRFWDQALYYTFEIFNIDYWATDGGHSLHTQEDGCGDLTGWEWTAATSSSEARAYFNIDFFIKAGCVERAIVSAGGPRISCKGQGFGKPPSAELDGSGDMPGNAPPYSAEEKKEFQEYYASLNETYTPYETMNWAAAGPTDLVSRPPTKLVYVYAYVDSA